MAMDINKLALALQGFGAGVAGQGQQFTQGLEDRRTKREALGRERLVAAAKDARGARNLLQKGDYQGALRLIDDRASLINQLGGDPSDTLMLRDKLMAGEFDNVMGELNRAVNRAVEDELIEADPQDRLVKTEGGQAIFETPEGKTRAERIEGFTETRDPREELALEQTRLAIATAQAQLAEIAEKRELRAEEKAEKKRLADNLVKTEAKQEIINLSSSIGTIDRALRGDGIEDATGISGVVMRRIPGSEAADVSAAIDTLQSQIFLSQVDKLKGMGALSEAEGRKLAAAAGSLDVENMSAKAIRSELNRIKGVYNKGIKKAQSLLDSGKVSPAQFESFIKPIESPAAPKNIVVDY